VAESVIQQTYDADEVSLLDYWRITWKHKWLIGILFLISTIGTLVISSLLPKIYVSRASIIVPTEVGAGGLLTSMASAVAGQEIANLAIPSLPSMTPNKDLFLSILKSRTIAKAVVKGLNLGEYYKTSHIEKAANRLRKATNITTSREGVISVVVEDAAPTVAANIANTYLEYLDRLMARFGAGAAGRQRVFIERRLVTTKRDLKQAEEGLRTFQEKNRTISLQDQARGAIGVTTQLKGEIIATEVQLQMVRNFATEANPIVISLRRRIDELKKQLAQMQFGAGLDLPSVGNNSGHSQKELHLPAVRFPEVGLAYARLIRDLKVQEIVYSLLTQQLEQTKIVEAKDTPVVQVLDRAVPAIRHSRPKVKLNVAIAGVASLFLGIFIAFLLEYTHRRKPQIANS